MKNVIVIALAGVRKSGKNTVGDLLESFHGFHQTAFATPLKQMAKIAFPQLTEDQLYGPSQHREDLLDIPLRGLDPRTGKAMLQLRHGIPTQGPDRERAIEHAKRNTYQAEDGVTYEGYLTPRLILQTLGTEWGRRIHADIWVDSCWNNIIAQTETPWQKWVITDCRFKNEIQGIRRRGGVIVKLLRGFDEAKERSLVKGNTDVHQSEAELLSIPDIEFDYLLDNRGALEELPQLVEEMLCVTEIAQTRIASRNSSATDL